MFSIKELLHHFSCCKEDNKNIYSHHKLLCIEFIDGKTLLFWNWSCWRNGGCCIYIEVVAATTVSACFKRSLIGSFLFSCWSFVEEVATKSDFLGSSTFIFFCCSIVSSLMVIVAMLLFAGPAVLLIDFISLLTTIVVRDVPRESTLLFSLREGVLIDKLLLFRLCCCSTFSSSICQFFLELILLLKLLLALPFPLLLVATSFLSLSLFSISFLRSLLPLLISSFRSL